MKYVLYNRLSNNGKGENSADEAMAKFASDGEKVDLVGLSVKEWLTKVTADDTIYLCGGDGTLNRFANDAYGVTIPCPVLLYKAGTGNDFYHDIYENYDKSETPEIRKYINRLPMVKVKDIECRFINGIGFGIDGMCCETADLQKGQGVEKIDYTGIAIRLLLFKYKRPNATVYIDGEEMKFNKVWFASAMNGRFYGGGMDNAPDQDRRGDELTAIVWHGGGKIRTLMRFPKIFKGTLINEKCIYAKKGHTIRVVFDRPTALQIDGETVTGVTEYTASKL
ncbi:MAG: diacylglycerol kinase family protein [Lachnospiraceae bacterium]|nr:diacylglycerol kinase family protein [Lachnospiraceae bacterium]